MADVEKAEKLAAARRRLEDFQKNKKKPEQHAQPTQPDEPLNSGHASGPNATVPPMKNHVSFSEDSGTGSSPVLFNPNAGYPHSAGASFYSAPQNTQMGVSSFSQSRETLETVNTSQSKENPPDSGGDKAFTPSIFNASAFLDSSKPVWDTRDWLQSKTEDNLKNTSDVLLSQTTATLRCEEPFKCDEELPKASPQYFAQQSYADNDSIQNGEGLSNVTPESHSVEAHTSPPATSNESTYRCVGTVNTHQTLFNGLSSSESLRILAEQMTELCEDGSTTNIPHSTASYTALENRIQDLNALLAAERSNNQQLQILLKESQARCVHLETKVAELRAESELTLAQRIGPLQEQLRAHAQTVGILVGEKTELEAALSHHIATAEQRTGEMEELHNRLRASRHRVNELEKELSAHTSKSQLNERQMQIYIQEQDRLKRENSVLSKQLEDVKEEASELRQKLNAKANEVASLENSLEEQQKQLSLAQLRVTQLSGVESPVMTSEVEALHQQKFSLEKRCTELTDALRVMGVERDQAAEQYQQYVTQLNSQLQSLSQKMDRLVSENENLRKREQELVHAMSELERHLQQSKKSQPVESDQLPLPLPAVEATDTSRLEAEIEALRLENTELLECLETKDQNIEELRNEVEDSKAHISELETLRGEEPDQSRLLAAMESDKVAASQATAQNAKLKDQVQELQEAFIKISNDKLQLTEDLENEKRVNSNMGKKIACLAEELHELRLLVAQRDRELDEYRGDHENSHNHDHSHCHKHGSSDQVDRNHNDELDHHHHHHHNHPSDHYHSHESEVKQFPDRNDSENDSTQQPIKDVTDPTNNNASLRCLLPQKSTESHESGSSSSVTEGATTDDGTLDSHSRGCVESHGMRNSYLSLQRAMEQLQARFTRTMSEYADLSDEKQKLEHLVLQLQGETETIGEYVTLYQIQRAALQQRAREKDHQLACLAEEREALRKKLADLSDLVCRLVEERKHFNKDNTHPNNARDHLTESLEEKNTQNLISLENKESTGVEGDSGNTAGQILALLNEIGTSSLVDNRMPENFHPCPWCSGRLITV